MRLVLLAALLAEPAAAQWGAAPRMPIAGATPPGWGAELGDTYRSIDKGKKAGQLSRREARQLKREAGFVGMLGRRYGADGLSDPEARELAARNAALHDEVVNRRSGGGPAGPPRDAR